MSNIKNKSRRELKSYFVAYATPTQQNFTDLIDTMIIQGEDPVDVVPNSPLRIKSGGNSTTRDEFLHFHKTFDDLNNPWILGQNTGTKGFEIATTTNTHLFISKTDGKVGIGTATPTEKLEVTGNLLLNAYTSSAGEKGLFFRRDHSQSKKYNLSILTYNHDGTGTDPDGLSINGYDGISFCTGADTRQQRMIVNKSGNVGIGTATPTEKLEVTGNLLLNAYTSSAGEKGLFFRRDHSQSKKYNLSILTYNHDGTGTDPDGLSINGYNGISFCTGADTRQQRMIVNKSGNVGIGTATPTEKLEVTGNLLLNAYTPSAGEKGLFFRRNHSQSKKYNLSILTYNHDSTGTDPDGLSINGYNGISFCTGADTRQQRMIVNKSGNVGIGTTTPTHKLEVNGNFKALTVNTGHGDYEIKSIAGYEGDQNLRTTDHATFNNITANGNVGIGTATPTEKLEVNGNLLLNAYTPSAGEKGLFFRRNHSQSKKYNLSILTYNHDSTGTDPDGLSINGYNGISFCTGADTRLQRMIVNKSGNVGIGTATPTHKLEVNGATNVNGDFNFLAGKTRLRWANANTENSRSYLVPRDTADTNWDWNQEFGYHYTNRAWYFDGNLGIGTVNPQAKLDVHGDIKTAGVVPFQFKRFTGVFDSKDTGVYAGDYNAAIVGFSSTTANISATSFSLSAYMHIDHTTWVIHIDTRSVGNHESWTVDVMFVRRELSSRTSY